MKKSIYVNLESGEGVMVFTENEQITPKVLEAAFNEIGMEVIEAYEVPEQDVPYYCYDPVYYDANFERNVLKKAEKWFASHSASA